MENKKAFSELLLKAFLKLNGARGGSILGPLGSRGVQNPPPDFGLVDELDALCFQVVAFKPQNLRCATEEFSSPPLG